MKKNYYTSKKKFNNEVSFGFFTRQGGFSFKNFSSLNCSFNSGDKDILIEKNILKAQKILSLANKKIKFVDQIHSNKTVIVDKNNYLKKFEADAIITQDKEICIAILTADCCPIFLFDDESKFVSCIHAGWKGVYSNIIKNNLNHIIKIQPDFNKIKAIIGPCLNKQNFQVSLDFKINFIKKNSEYSKYFTSSKNEKYLFDMRSLIKYQISNNGIKNIDNININTYQNRDMFFSHRRSTHLNQLPTGRMINIIGFNI